MYIKAQTRSFLYKDVDGFFLYCGCELQNLAVNTSESAVHNTPDIGGQTISTSVLISSLTTSHQDVKLLLAYLKVNYCTINVRSYLSLQKIVAQCGFLLIQFNFTLSHCAWVSSWDYSMFPILARVRLEALSRTQHIRK